MTKALMDMRLQPDGFGTLNLRTIVMSAQFVGMAIIMGLARL